MHTLKPRPASHSEMLGGEIETDFFLREIEGLEPVQTLVPIAANCGNKPEMTNAAPCSFLHKVRFAVVCVQSAQVDVTRKSLMSDYVILMMPVIASLC